MYGLVSVYGLVLVVTLNNQLEQPIRASWPMISMSPYKNISHIQVLVTNFCPTPPKQLKLGLQVGGRLLIANHLDQSNDSRQLEISSSQQIRFDCSRAPPRLWKLLWDFSQFEWIHPIGLMNLIQNVQCSQLLNIGGDALRLVWPEANTCLLMKSWDNTSLIPVSIPSYILITYQPKISLGP